MLQGTVITEFDPTMRNIVDAGDVVETIGEVGQALGDIWDEIFNRKQELLDELAQAQTFEEQQEVISQINEYELVTISQQIDAIPGRDNLPEALQQELEALKETGNIAATEELSPQEIEQIKIADTKRRERIREIAEVAEDGSFVETYYNLVNNDPSFKGTFENLKKLVEYFESTKELCQQEGWASYKDQGIVPWCIWKEAEILRSMYYSKVDLPFVSGVIDGVCQEGEGLVELPKMLYKLGNSINDFIYAYTLAYYQCSPTKVEMNEKRLGMLIDKLKANEETEGVWSWLKTQWYSVENYVATYKDNKCGDAAKLRAEIDELIGFISEIENIKRLIEDIQEDLASYWGQIEQQTNIGRYEEGKITVIVGSLFFSAGTLVVAKIGRVKQILQKLHTFTKSQWDEFFEKANKRLERGVANAGSDWKLVQKIRNKYPNEALPSDGALWGIAQIDNGLIEPIGNKGKTFKNIDFVVTAKGELKLGKKHHFLGNASDVEAAGTLKITNGKIKRISNDSGHYFPTPEEASKYPEIFRQLGFDTKDVILETFFLDANNKLKSTTKFLTE